MYLDEVLAAQKRGEAKSIPSICSAHPFVVAETLRSSRELGIPALIESTCNQVNQYGGYTGMTPKDFVAYVRHIANENNLPFENIILGGDHLGPSVWQNEPAESAMQKSEVMIRDYVQAGFAKIHLDCSMKLADDPVGVLDVNVIAKRSARLARVAENSAKSLRPSQGLRYVIGSEVPTPGGAISHEEGVGVTKVEDVRQTIATVREAFYREGLQSAWEQVLALVVQPGVEFGDDFVLPYQQHAATLELCRFIEDQPLMYEAHSTDYQTLEALKDLTRDHFGILKVGPRLTFVFREAIFSLARMENELFSAEKRSNIVEVLDNAMVRNPEYWKKYYRGTDEEQSFKRKYSLSDRARYYWAQPDVNHAFKVLLENLGDKTLPDALLSEFAGCTGLTAFQVIQSRIHTVLVDYFCAGQQFCGE